MGKIIPGISKIDRLSELVLLPAALSIFLVVQFPLKPEPNIMVMLVTTVFVAIFELGWHRLRLPIPISTKNFLEIAILTASIWIVVHASGGIYSFFNYWYILPLLRVSTTMTKWHALGIWLLIGSGLFFEAVYFQQTAFASVYTQISPLGVAFILSGILAIIAIYNYFLSNEYQSAQTATAGEMVESEKEVNKLKDEFVFVISHELRGPITAIRGYLELLTSGIGGHVEEPVRQIALAASRQGDRLNTLIAELLDLSRLETGKFRLTIENFDVDEYLKKTLESVSIETKEKKIQFYFKPTPAPLIVAADKERVKEVVLHLIADAIKYTGEFGQIWVWTEEKGDLAVISVADTGVGIPPEKLKHLFDRFDEPIEGKQREVKHISVGLFLIKSLVEKMGGTITAESQVGKGSKFTFTLPKAKT